jgi:hypothetical protein
MEPTPYRSYGDILAFLAAGEDLRGSYEHYFRHINMHLRRTNNIL